MKESEDTFTRDEVPSPEHLDKSSDEASEEQYGDGEEDGDHDRDEPESVEDIETSKLDTIPADDFKIEHDEALQKLIDGTRIIIFMVTK